MKQFPSIEKLDIGILYSLELLSSVSVLLLAFGLIASMANVLTNGAILSDNLIMSRIWSVTQCVAIDASVAGTIIRTCRYLNERSWVKFSLYALLSAFLLFTAAIVSNIESIQQTLNITLDSAYSHVFIPVEGLIWVRSIAIVLLIVAHAVKYVQIETASSQISPIQQDISRSAPEIAEPDQEEQTTITPLSVQQVKQLAAPQEKSAYERVKAYVADHPDAKGKEVSIVVGISIPTANKWLARIRNSQ